MELGQVEIDLPHTNQDISEQLFLISSYYLAEGDTYRARAYSNADTAIQRHPVAITSGSQAREELRGIGVSIASDIDAYLNTGSITRLRQLEEKHAEKKRILDLFLSIYGIGPVTANKFYELGYRTLEDLWYKASLTPAQKLGILYRKHLSLRIERYEMDLINDRITELLTEYDPDLEFIIAGSYRRNEPTSGDIDLLIKGSEGISLQDIVRYLEDNGLIVGTFALGMSKFMGILRLSDQYNAHRLDILIINPESWATALLYFTGSQRFNILLRLNEYGLFDQEGRRLPTETEEDIFDYLGIRYLSPEERRSDLQKL